MPILSRGPAVARLLAQGVEEPSVAYFETVGLPVFTWIDPDGVQWPLSNHSEDIGWFTLMGPEGYGGAEIDFATDSLPGGGEDVRFVQRKPFTLQWPMEIFGRDHSQFVRRRRRLAKALQLTTLRRRPGTLRVQRPDGTIREAQLWYREGLRGEAGQGHLFERPVISFFCPEGVWRSADDVVAVRTFTPTTDDPDDPDGDGVPGGGTGNPVSFYAPFLSLTSSKVVGSATPNTDPDNPDAQDPDGTDTLTSIVNAGDLEAWPVWTITGPMTALRAANNTLGARFALTYDLDEGQIITITTAPGAAAVRGPGDQNLSKYIDWLSPTGAELWPLLDGVNQVTLEVDGYGPSTRVQLSYRQRFDEW